MYKNNQTKIPHTSLPGIIIYSDDLTIYHKIYFFLVKIWLDSIRFDTGTHIDSIGTSIARELGRRVDPQNSRESVIELPIVISNN